MRAFIAIEMPETVRESLGALRERFRRSGARASWVQTANMHLTLRFLGDVARDDLSTLSAGLREACCGCAPLRLGVRGAGAFPSLRRPSVVWAGLKTLSGDLGAVQRCAEAAARAIGLPPETKPFHPHVTLARIRDTRQLGTLPDDLDAARDFDGGDFTAAHVSLFSSELKPGGAVYRCLQEFVLACPAPMPSS